MNIELPAHSVWAKLVAMQPDNQNIVMSTDRTEYPFDDKFIIYQNQDNQTFIQNISATCLHIDDHLLEIHQEQQLFGAEKLNFEQEKDNTEQKVSYVFCFVHLEPGFKRDRDDLFESQSLLKKLVEVENDLQKEITCSICTTYPEKCMILTPCLHSFCSFCLFDHLKLSSKCPLCRVEAVSVAKNNVLSNVAQLAIDHFPTLQKPQKRKELEEINFGGAIIRYEGGVYIGSFVNGKKEGTGKFIYQCGHIYEGSWKNDQREGKGVLMNKNGDKYDGDWMNFRFQGFGKYIWNNGGEYEGEWQNGARHGYGIKKYADGNVYKGDWKKSSREGKGVLSYPCGDKYDGSWMNDSFNGMGKFTWSSGQEYEGDFKGGTRHGYGIMKYRGGNSYKGDWRNGKRAGKGILTLNNGDLCEGIWVNDVLQPGVKIKYSTGERYLGEIEVESFKRQGREIEFDSIKRHGKGILVLKNGIKQVGNWKNDIFRKRFTF